MTNRKIVSPSDRAFSYMGRIDFSKPDSPLFIYAGSMVSTIAAITEPVSEPMPPSTTITSISME